MARHDDQQCANRGIRTPSVKNQDLFAFTCTRREKNLALTKRSSPCLPKRNFFWRGRDVKFQVTVLDHIAHTQIFQAFSIALRLRSHPS
jgi:hypothetical protein